MKDSPGLYIHIPFCKSKCIYCDFYSGGISDEKEKLYIEALLNELRLRKNELHITPDTIYLGGGTPSLLKEDSFKILVEGIFNILPDINTLQEFTVEANPEDVTHEKCKLWKSLGVNRISMGVQSFHDDELMTIRRRHTASTAIEAYRLLRKYFQNISIDLMFGLPGQTISKFEKNIDTAIELNPEHISCYSLTIEPKTPIQLLIAKGKLELPKEENYVKMWNLLNIKLKEAGYLHYEISNYSKPGHESVHNSKYWHNIAYLGLGPSAHSYDGIEIRRFNPSFLNRYLDYYSDIISERINKEKDEQLAFYKFEKLTSTELKEEMIMTSLRTSEGLNTDDFTSRFGVKAYNELMAAIKKYEQGDLLTINNEKISLTERGMMISDNIISNIFVYL